MAKTAHNIPSVADQRLVQLQHDVPKMVNTSINEDKQARYQLHYPNHLCHYFQESMTTHPKVSQYISASQVLALYCTSLATISQHPICWRNAAGQAASAGGKKHFWTPNKLHLQSLDPPVLYDV